MLEAFNEKRSSLIKTVQVVEDLQTIRLVDPLRPIFFKGLVKCIGEAPYDPVFCIKNPEFPYIYRNVEVYCWSEYRFDFNSTDEHGSTTRVKKDEYTAHWVNSLKFIDSS